MPLLASCLPLVLPTHHVLVVLSHPPCSCAAALHLSARLTTIANSPKRLSLHVIDISLCALTPRWRPNLCLHKDPSEVIACMCMRA